MLAQLTESYPEQVLLVGCQPEELEDYGGSLRPIVRAAMEDALALGVEALRRWGAEPVERREPLAEDESVTFPLLAIERYEGQRPSEAVACRIGDDRFMAVLEPTAGAA